VFNHAAFNHVGGKRGTTRRAIRNHSGGFGLDCNALTMVLCQAAGTTDNLLWCHTPAWLEDEPRDLRVRGVEEGGCRSWT
jgi:hypothetical protein